MSLWGRLARLQPWYLLVRYPNRFTRALFAFISSVLAMGIMGLAVWYTDQPLIFPSLGPSAFAFFFRPSAPSSAPRNAILAHTSGIAIGLISYKFISQPVNVWVGAALSLGLVAALMILADLTHPPAASTTLFVSLGVMTSLQELAAILCGVLLLTLQALVINRLSGIAFPLWRGQKLGSGDLVASALKTEVTRSREDLYSSVAQQLATRGKVRPAPKD